MMQEIFLNPYDRYILIEFQVLIQDLKSGSLFLTYYQSIRKTEHLYICMWFLRLVILKIST